MVECIEAKLDYDDIRNSLLNILPDKCPDDTKIIIALLKMDNLCLPGTTKILMKLKTMVCGLLS